MGERGLYRTRQRLLAGVQRAVPLRTQGAEQVHRLGGMQAAPRRRLHAAAAERRAGVVALDSAQRGLAVEKGV
ncbi:hypothetical protein [Xanthomonas theicola]|uniref:Uncharacterized protein n=1 Tax=Xanthomonas theicola TaxID=56464 RepID=A0A2S6ZIB7_9XANT|nr:hypothetical protein [Xanthomonas theicola]PPT92023.1 hypothetical protein XthCFBP4691_05700 [Xanthomonas theicola]QNH23593.1 hypothetical protein G4Q83_00770 [Xanthomonas theicola]